MLMMEIFFDGWYYDREDAVRALEFCVTQGGTSVGIVDSDKGSWGLLYVAPRVLFENHRLDDATNALWSALRHGQVAPR